MLPRLTSGNRPFTVTVSGKRNSGRAVIVARGASQVAGDRPLRLNLGAKECLHATNVMDFLQGEERRRGRWRRHCNGRGNISRERC